MALNAETENMMRMALNVDLEIDDGSKRRTVNTVMALNAETKK